MKHLKSYNESNDDFYKETTCIDMVFYRTKY